MPQSSSDLDTDQGDIIDETLKHIVQRVNQMLLKASTGRSSSNLDSSDTSHDNTQDRQSVSTLNTGDVHKHTNTSPETLTDQTH